MSGLEKIIGSITDEAEKGAQALMLKAEEEVAAIRADGDARTREDTDKIRKRALDEVANIETRAQASAELRKKQILLGCKQEMINTCIEEAKEYPSSLDDAAYFALLTKVFRKHAPKKNAVLYLNAQDLQRIPEDVRRSFTAIAQENGSTLSFATEPVRIRSGFVLDFGGVEENCSIDALIDQNLEEIQDRVYQVLFA